MAQEFPGLPDNVYEYQNQFDYSVWTPNTEITCATVPWDSSYRDIVRFDSKELRDQYFSEVKQYGYSFNLTGMVYLRYGEPVRVNAPFSMINQCNYLIVRNPIQPVPDTASGFGVPPRKPDVFYYFINDVKYIAPNTTQLNVQLDVWQTYYDRLSFGMCYINKGHVGIANENSTQYNLRDYLTDTEGLNIGDEYDVTYQWFYNFQDEAPYIIIMSTTNLEGDYGTISNPKLTTSKGDVDDGMPSGSRTYALSAENFKTFMENIADYPWVSQGISMITVVPRVFCQVSPTTVEIAGVTANRLPPNPDVDGTRFVIDDVFNRYDIPDRYKHLYKFFTSPYSFIEMTALNGGEIVLKNECLDIGDVTTGQHDAFIVRTRSICAPPQIRGMVMPLAYNSSGKGSDDGSFTVDYVAPDGNNYTTYFGSGEFMDLAVMYQNFPQFALVNNMYLYYMASNAHSLQYQFQSADWSQQKALTGASLSYNQATQNMNTAWANQQVANNANWALSGISQEKNVWNGVQGAASNGLGAVGSLLSGDIGGAINGAANAAGSGVNAALNADWINRTTSTQVGAATQTTQNNIANQQYMRDTNYDYARFAAKGDYENAIAGIQAKVQDAKLTQPSTSGQNGGDPFNMSNGFCGILFKWKRLKTNFLVQVGDFWLRYGYYVNRWMRPPQDLKCMSNFTYWKMQQVQVNGMLPELFKETIRGIFEKGVTVWTNPNNINNIDLADNDIVEGVRY